MADEQVNKTGPNDISVEEKKREKNKVSCRARYQKRKSKEVSQSFSGRWMFGENYTDLCKQASPGHSSVKEAGVRHEIMNDESTKVGNKNSQYKKGISQTKKRKTTDLILDVQSINIAKGDKLNKEEVVVSSSACSTTSTSKRKTTDLILTVGKKGVHAEDDVSSEADLSSETNNCHLLPLGDMFSSVKDKHVRQNEPLEQTLGSTPHKIAGVHCDKGNPEQTVPSASTRNVRATRKRKTTDLLLLNVLNAEQNDASSSTTNSQKTTNHKRTNVSLVNVHNETEKTGTDISFADILREEEIQKGISKTGSPMLTHNFVPSQPPEDACTESHQGSLPPSFPTLSPVDNGSKKTQDISSVFNKDGRFPPLSEG